MNITLTEEWRPVTVAEFAGLYEVSSLGQVRSLGRIIMRSNGRSQTFHPKVMKPYPSDWGYLKTCLTRDSEYKRHIFIHRIVAIEFIPNPDNLPEVNHMDGVKTNNVWTNLEWCTNDKNLEHAYVTGLARYTPKDVREQVLALAGTASQESIGQQVGIDQTTVSRIIRGVRGRHRIKQSPLAV